MLNVRKCTSFYFLIINVRTKILRRDETQRLYVVEYVGGGRNFAKYGRRLAFLTLGTKGVHKMRLRGKDVQLLAGVYAAAECRDPRNERTFVQLVLKT